jgi:two-component system chemotaxis sensor kinase CheA
MDFELELKQTFLEEATQLLDDVEQCFLTLESNPSDAGMIERIFRLAHNLKGSAKAVGFKDINEVAHEFENLLLKLKSGAVASSPEIISVMLKTVDWLRQSVESKRGDVSSTIATGDIVTLLVDTREGRHASSVPTASHEESRDESADYHEAHQQSNKVDGLQLFEPSTLQLPIQQPPTSGPVASPSPVVATSPNSAPSKNETPPQAAKPAMDESIRVSIGRLERLINAVGEVVILNAVLQQQSAESGSDLLRRTGRQMGKSIREIQDISMTLRMLPLKSVFQKMQRIVRDTSGILKKEIEFVTQGEDTEVDKTVYERLSDPLVHLIRNSVDHGIEDAGLRETRGKSRKGRIHLTANQLGGKLVVEVKDDGGGLDPEKLASIAKSKGLIPQNALLSKEQAQALIFAAGFSTKKEVTDVSGRGVGMDVVRTNIQELGGEIQIISDVGVGTTFRIILPLSLAIIEGMVVASGSQRFIVALSQVHETVRWDAGRIKSAPGIGDVLLLRNENIPLYGLSKIMGHNGNPGNDQSILIVRPDSGPFGIVVDEILTRAQVVVKNLNTELRIVKGATGTTILGDGKPAFIIDLVEITKSQSGVKRSNAERKIA